MIKASLASERRRLALDQKTLTFATLRTALAAVFHTPVSVRYLDDDGDDIGITSDVELDAALLTCGALLRLTLDAEDSWGAVKKDDDEVVEVIEICEDASLESARVGGNLERCGGVRVGGLKRLSGAVEGRGGARGDGSVIDLDDEAVVLTTSVRRCRTVGGGGHTVAVDGDGASPKKRRRVRSAEEDGVWRRNVLGAERSTSASPSLEMDAADVEAAAGQCAEGFVGGGPHLLEDNIREPDAALVNFCGSLVLPTPLPVSDGSLGTFPPGNEELDCSAGEGDDSMAQFPNSLLPAATDGTSDASAGNAAEVVQKSSKEVCSLSKAAEGAQAEDCELAERVVDLGSTTRSLTHQPPLAVSSAVASAAPPFPNAADTSATGACVPSSPPSRLAPSLSARCSEDPSPSPGNPTAADLSSLPSACSHETDDGVVSVISIVDSEPGSPARLLAASVALSGLAQTDGEKDTAPAPIRRSLRVRQRSGSPQSEQLAFTEKSRGAPRRGEFARANSRNVKENSVVIVGAFEPSYDQYGASFSLDEDMLLLGKFDVLGYHWKSYEKLFPERSRTQIRRRFYNIKRTLQRNGAISLTEGSMLEAYEKHLAALSPSRRVRSESEKAIAARLIETQSSDYALLSDRLGGRRKKKSILAMRGDEELV